MRSPRKLLRSLRNSFKQQKSQGWVRLADLPEVETVIDVGVAGGTPLLYDRYPAAKLILIDCLKESEQAVKAAMKSRPYEFVCTALGDRDGTISVTVEKTSIGRSSVLPRTALTSVAGEKEIRDVPLTSLDQLFPRLAVKGSYGLKVDTEGYELTILRGAKSVLGGARFVIAECSVEQRFESSYRFEDLIGFMAEQGFRVHSLLSANEDYRGIIRFVDLAFVRSEPRQGAADDRKAFA